MKGSSILIAEDEMIIAMEIRATLKKLGYDVAGTVISGFDAIRTAGEKRPDLVLMDIRLKGDMDGIEAAEKIMELYDIPIIFLTGNSDKTTVERAVAIKPAGFLIKPFKERELFGNIEMAIHKQKVRTQIKTKNPDKKTDSIAKIISEMKAPLISADKNGIITRANQSAENFTGVNTDKLIGRKIQDIFSITENPQTNTTKSSELSFIWPDGVILTTQENNKQIHLSAGFIINDLKEIEDFLFSLDSGIKNLAEDKKVWIEPYSLMDSFSEIIFTVSNKMEILNYNNKFVNLAKRLGISTFQLSRPLYEILELSSFISPDEYTEVIRAKMPLVKTKRFKTSNNEINYFKISIIPNFKEESVDKVTVIIEDLTPAVHSKEHAKYITDSLVEIENSLSGINSIVNNIKKPLIDIIKTCKTASNPSSERIIENANEIIEILENFDVQRIKYEDAIDHIKFMDKTAENW